MKSKMGFDEEVWALIEMIPRGRVTTYKIIAEKLGSKAYRAVGNACSRNPNAPKVPCHRVVNSDGRVGGYMGRASGAQVERKIRILREEGVEVEDGKILNFERILFRF
ncbi:MAG: MGMT family protein [Candidatus Bathyarchaeia archaeon]